MEKSYPSLPVIFLLCLTVLAGCAHPVSGNYAGTSYSDTDFIKVNGLKLFTSDGKSYTIRSMGFGNDAFGERSEIPRNHHTEDSYRELHEMGFNTVRFYLTYKMFETNEHPYEYNQEAFDWLDKNVAWAKKNNIHIILDMQTPQGGYQSTGNGLALFKESENQTRLARLWRAIARHFKNCSTIIGYDLVNEPQVPFDTDVRTSVDVWSLLAQRCINEIRKEDSNHIIFVERITGMWDNTHRWYDPDPVYAYPDVQDSKLVFQGHYYLPFYYTHQGQGQYAGVTSIYPSASVEPIWKYEATQRFDSLSPSFPTTWTRREYTLNQWDASQVNALRVAVKTGEFGNVGSILIDDITLTRHDSDGKRTIIATYSFDSFKEADAWHFGSQNNSGSMQWYTTDGNSAKGCLKVTGTTAASWVTAPDVELLETNCTYTMSFYCKFLLQTSSYGSFGFDLEYVPYAGTVSRYQILHDLQQWSLYPRSVNKPLFIGEFGCYKKCFKINCGVQQYLTDCMTAFSEYTCGYSYHVYHEDGGFGLYDSNVDTLPTRKDRNDTLYNLLCQLNQKLF